MSEADKTPPTTKEASGQPASPILELLDDPSFRNLVEEMAQNPSFIEMVKQFGEAGFHNLDEQQYHSIMQQVMQNSKFIDMVAHVGNALVAQDPAMFGTPEGLTKLCNKAQLGDQILRDFENGGGAAAIARYLNDEGVLKKLDEILGLAVSAEAAGEDET